MAQPLIPVGDLSTIVNSLAHQHTGQLPIVNDDLSNLADFGAAYENLDGFTKQIVTSGMITLVTTQLFITKQYTGNGIDIIRSRGEYDANSGMIQKNRPQLPDSVSDTDVYDPQVGSTNDPFQNYPINFETEYFFKPFSDRYQWSEPKRWMTGMFNSVDGLMRAVASINQMVQNAMELNIEDTTMAAVRASMVLNMSEVTDLGGVGTTRAINLLATYNQAYSTSLAAANALRTPDFLRYAIHEMFVVMDYMKAYTRLYNEKKYPNFTKREDCHFILLSQFNRAVDQFLLSDAFHDEYLKLPLGESVAAWKGFLLTADSKPDFASTSTLNDTISVDWEDSPLSVNTNGIIGTIFDKERVGIYDLSVVNTNQNDPVGLKTNYWTHVFGKTIVDPYDNGVTFYIKDPA